MAKLSSYQKLKQEVVELKRQLMVVCTEPNSIEAITITARKRFGKDIEKAVWAGNDIGYTVAFKGLLPKINYNGKA